MIIKNNMKSRGKKCESTNKLFTLICIAFLFVSLVLPTLFCNIASGESYQQNPVYDTYVDSLYGDNNYSSSGSIIVGYGNDSTYGHCKGFLRWDLSSIPNGSNVTSAYFQVYRLGKQYGSYGNYMNIYRVNETWTHPTWNTQPNYNDSIVWGTIYFNASSGWGPQVNLTSLVQGWVDGDFENYGICVYRNISHCYTFNDSNDPGTAPILHIEYIAPPTVMTNTSTGIEETNATLKGYLVDDGGESCTVWFEYYPTIERLEYNTETTGASSGYNGISNPAWKRAQTFTIGTVGPNESYDIHHLLIRCLRFGSPGTAYFSIRNVTGDGAPTGVNLSEGSLNANDITTSGGGDWYQINMTSYTLLPGTQYAIVVQCPNVDGSNWFAIRRKDDVYAGGRRWLEHGTGWTPYTDTDWGFQVYGQNWNWSKTTNQTKSTGDSFDANISSLTPGQLYHHRSYAENTVSSNTGSDTTFLTKPNEPTNLVAAKPNSTQINLTWTKGSGANKTVIRRDTSDYPETPQSGTEIYNGTDTSYNDTSLAQNTYYYRAWSYSTWDSFQQLSDSYAEANNTIFGSPTITTNTSTGVEETNATLQGYLLEDGEESCTVRFEWGLNTSFGNTTSNQTISEGNTFNANISSLANGTLYMYRAIANNSNSTVYGSNETFLTKPNSTTNFTATTQSTSQINLAWNNGTGGDGAYIRYTTGSALSPWDVGDGTKIDADGRVTTPYNHTGLSSGTHYYYKIWAYASDGGWTSSGNASAPYSDNPQTADATTQSGGGGGGGGTTPDPPDEDEPEQEPSTTTKEEVENLYNITLVQNFYASDTDGDEIVDNFTDPNDILNAEHFVTINGNASFLISVNNDTDKLFIWDTEADNVIQVTHNVGTVTNTVINTQENTITLTVNIEKANWTYIEVSDEYPEFNVTIKTADGRIISSDMIWRENNKIYVLDDLATEYHFIYNYEEAFFLFDVVLELIPTSVYVGENINALIELTNVGEPGLVNGTVNYTLSKEGGVVWSEEENVSVLGQKAFNKTISTEGLTPGEYTFEAVYSYGDNQAASAQVMFTVNAQPQPPAEEIPLWILIVLVVILIIILIIVYLFKIDYLYI